MPATELLQARLDARVDDVDLVAGAGLALVAVGEALAERPVQLVDAVQAPVLGIVLGGLLDDLVVGRLEHLVLLDRLDRGILREQLRLLLAHLRGEARQDTVEDIPYGAAEPAREVAGHLPGGRLLEGDDVAALDALAGGGRHEPLALDERGLGGRGHGLGLGGGRRLGRTRGELVAGAVAGRPRHGRRRHGGGAEGEEQDQDGNRDFDTGQRTSPKMIFFGDCKSSGIPSVSVG
ncbi:hypothetical protein GCM10022419_129890 [Nonomuraea rosea]|uniref:Uncharacterized protein n=1 Tax=Nonomuraea rosea TaxID=638574 RepID=A0ABP7A0H0_9ACTN